MDQHEWLVFTCRACRKVIKLSPAMAGSDVVCPFCRTKVSVPADAPLVTEKAHQTAIPSSRSNDDMMSQLRGTSREDWEVGKRPIGGELPFRDRLHSTTAPRMQPDAPDLPDVVRVNMRRRKHEQNHEDFDDPERTSVRRRSRHKRIRSKGQRFGNTMVRGLVISVVILAGAVAWLGWQQYHKPKPEPVHKPAFVQRETVTLEPSPDGPKLETRSMAEYGPALRDAVRRFLTAPTLDHMLKFIRDRERVEPKIRAWYTQENPWKPIEVRAFEPSEFVQVDGDFITFPLFLPNFEEVPIGLERKGDTFLVDWECFVGYGDLSWELLMKQRPQHPVLMRVVLEYSPETDYFNGVFADASKYHCYRVRDNKSQHSLSGYCPKEAPLDTVIRKHLKLEPPPSNLYKAFAVVRLRYPATGSSDNQVEITEFLESGWVFRPGNN